MPMTKRMEKLKDRLFNKEYHDPGVWHFKNVNILNERPELKGEALVIRKAHAQKYMGENLLAIIKDDELIVGNPNQNSVGWGTVLPIYYSEEEGEIASRYQLNEASVWGHHPPDWGKIILQGTSGIKEKISAEIKKIEAFPDDFFEGKKDTKQEAEIQKFIGGVSKKQMKLNELNAMLIALAGLEAFGERHAKLAREMSEKEADKTRKNELLKIAEVCANVPKNPARNFHEALQAYWFAYAMVNSGGEYVPLGRADQFIYPFYERDIQDGKLTKEEAKDLLASFLVKCNERVIQDTHKAENHYNFGLFSQGTIPDPKNLQSDANQTGGYSSRSLTWQDDEDIDSDANFNYGQSGNDWLMNCIVGGVDEKGNDVTTEVSFMFVDIMHEMGLIMPTLAARFHKKSPEEWYRKVAAVLRYGQGEPMVYNDESIIPGFTALGIPLENARDYSNDGCWETLIQGKSHFSYAHVLNIRCVEWVLFRGISQHNGEREGLDTGDIKDFKTYEDFYQAYKKQANYYIDKQCEMRLANYGLSYMIAPDPLISSIMDDCVVKASDLSQDGARFVFHQILVTGFSTTVDSLMVVKKMVFDERKISIEELRDALADDWEGHDELRARAINSVPKWGNDIEEVDKIGVRVLDDFANHVSEWNDREERILFVNGIGTFENYAALGRDIAASPDGRYKGDALAPNYTPMPGVDINGPTAAIKSVTKADLLRYYSGSPLDLSINSREVEGEAGITRLIGLIKSFLELGGQILTITSTNVEDLEDAKIHPENHKSLRIRMGGLSAYFIAMSPIQQDNIIKRFSR